MARRSLAPSVLSACWTLAIVAIGCGDPELAGRVYLGSGLTDQVFVLDAASGRILDTLPLDPRPGEMDEPHGLAVAPDGRHWYATVSHGEPTLWKHETAGERLVGRLTLSLPGAGRIGIAPDGTHAVVGDYWRTGQGAESSVALVRLRDLVEVSTATVCPAPHDAVFDPTGTRVAITCALGDELVVVDGSTLETRARFPVGPDPGPPGAPRYRPLNLVWSAGGSGLIATLAAAGEVLFVAPDGSRQERVSVGGMPTQLALTPDGGRVIVVNRAEGNLSVIDVSAPTVLRTIPLPASPNPHGIALDRTGSVAYVSYEGTTDGPGGAVAIDLASGGVLWHAEAGAYALGIAYRPVR